MPQLSNITIGPAVSIAVSEDRLFRVVPQVPGSASVAFEHSVVGSPELATKISAATKRQADMAQKTMLRLTNPILRDVEGVQTRVASAIVTVDMSFPRQASKAERAAALDVTIKALKHSFFTSVIEDGEAMT